MNMKRLLLIVLLLPGFVSAQRFIQITSMQRPGGAPTPTISETGSFTAFSTVSGVASSPQTITVSGTALTAGVVVTFSGTSAFEVSKDGTTYASTQTLAASSGTLIGQPVTIYVRITAAAPPASESGTVVLSSTGATPVSVAISGTISAGGATFKAITIDHTKIPNTDQSNFPMSFDITQTYLKSVANGGGVVNASGFDINFSADNIGATPLSWDLVSWNIVTGRITGTVRIPTASHTTNTVIYISYGNASITTFQGSVAGSVWDGNYLRAYHMDEVLTGASQTIKDWTANAGNMTSVGSWVSGQSVAGKIGNGLKLLNSTSTYATFSSIALTSTYTIEGWFNPTSATPDGDTYSFTGTSSNDQLAWGDAPGYVALFTNNSSNKVQSAGFPTPTPGTPWASNAWHHLVVTRTGTTWTMYLDGVSNATSAQGTNLTINALGFLFGFVTNDIICDELRISNSVRSADWITASYNNQSSPSTFYSVAP